MPLDMKLALIAVFVQVALTFYSAITMGVARLGAIKEHNIKLGDVALSSTNYPADAIKHGNNLANQFEFPILLYTGVVLSIQLDAGSMLFSIACLGYVITRCGHRYVHVTKNDVRTRFKLFLLGLLFLFVAWVLLAASFAGWI